MTNAIRSFFATAIFTLSVVISGAAPPFVPPADVIPPFRRDKLPIDTDAMVSLSRTMTLLSQGASLGEASHRRTAAQALALALALDPANSSAHDILSAFIGGRSLQAPDPEKIARAKIHAWKFNSWLSTPEAGKDGNLLADLLGDTLASLDPDHPAADLLKSPERGKWDGWVAFLPSFKEKKIIRLEKPDVNESKLEPIKPKVKPTGISLTKATVKTVLFAYDKKTDGYVFGNTTVSMEAQPKLEEWEASGNLQFKVPCREESVGDVKEFVVSPIINALEKSEVALPDDGRISFQAGGGDIYSFRKNTVSLTGPGFVLAHAALTGVEPDATVFGVINTSGKLTSPRYLWYVVDKLREGDGGRLVIPADSAEFFAALLTLEEPDFFLKYEVFTASSPEEMAKLCAKKPDEKQVAISVKFKEIKDKAPSSTLGFYLVNRFVRQRLLDIHTEMPQHFSAKMLALQGSSERPPRILPKNILAAMIWHAIAPIKAATSFGEEGIFNANSKALDNLYDTSRAELDLLNRFVDRDSTELLDRAKSVTSGLRTLVRALSSRSDDWDAKYNAIIKAHKELEASNEQIRRELSLVTGDPLPDDLIESLRKEREQSQD
jgi:hypothetical protein